MPTNQSATTRNLRDEYEILRIHDICALLKRSRSGIYAALNPSSAYYEPEFPTQIRLSKRNVGWLAGEIYEYIDRLSKEEVLS